MHKLFPSQSLDEKVYIAVREHWVLLALRIVIWAFFVVLLIVFYMFGPEAVPGLFEGTGALITKLVTEVYLMMLALSLLIIFVLYYLNLHIITSVRIVDIDQSGLFHHEISELNIDKIEDVTSETNGVLGNIFDYGTVYVQTAGAKERFEFTNVPDPAKLVKIILDLYELNGKPEKRTGLSASVST